MKFNCGPTWEQKIEAKKQWHRHFILWPRRMRGDTHDCRWLEYVERKGTRHQGSTSSSYWWSWIYRSTSILPNAEYIKGKSRMLYPNV